MVGLVVAGLLVVAGDDCGRAGGGGAGGGKDGGSGGVDVGNGHAKMYCLCSPKFTFCSDVEPLH